MLADTVKYPFSDQRNRTLEAKFWNFANNDMRYLKRYINVRHSKTRPKKFLIFGPLHSFQVCKRSGVGSFTAELIHPIKFIEYREK